MKAIDLDSFLARQIPITQSLGLKVLRADPSRVEVWAPLAANHNHMGTAFGGSLNAVLVVACYSWLFNILQARGLPFHVVIKSSQIQYLKPVGGDFTCVCEAPAADLVERFLKTLERRNRAQLTLAATAFCEGEGDRVGDGDGEAVCRFEGEFVAL